jgi:hypothetical protein
MPSGSKFSIGTTVKQWSLRVGEGALAVERKLLFVGANAGAESAEGVARAHHYGEADLACHALRVVEALNGFADRSLYVDFLELLYKKVAVFGNHDCLYRCAEHLHTIFVEHAVEIQLRAAVQCRLSAEGEKYAVGAFLLDYLLHEVGRNRQEIHLVGNALRRLYGGDVGVDEHTRDALFA